MCVCVYVCVRVCVWPADPARYLYGVPPISEAVRAGELLRLVVSSGRLVKVLRWVRTLGTCKLARTIVVRAVRRVSMANRSGPRASGGIDGAGDDSDSSDNDKCVRARGMGGGAEAGRAGEIGGGHGLVGCLCVYL
jgi:hypothetical protein